jgi:YVTN family beta-propeller protein
MRARELAIDAALAAGEHSRVAGELDALVAEHPLREHLHAQRMLALYRSGRQAEALEVYRHAHRTLVEQVGIEPGPELRQMHEAILRQDPELDAPATRLALPSPRARRALVLGAIAVALAGVVAFALTRLLAPGSLARIDADWVGLIDSGDGRITTQYEVGHAPVAIAAGAGSVWVANTRDGTVSRLDGQREPVTTIDVGGEPTAMAFGARSLWVADGEGRRLVQVNPRTNRVVDERPVGNAPRGVVATDDAVWVASAVDGRVDRVDLARAGDVHPIPVPAGPAAVAAGFGSVWVAGEEAGAVVRLEPRSGTPVRTVAVGNGPAALAAGEGGVWVANREDGTVSRIDPTTTKVTETIPVGGAPSALAAGDGAVWVAVEVRRALNLAIDRSRVVEMVGGAVFAASSCQIIPPGLAGYVPTCPYTRSPRSGVWTGADLARARRLVTASGTRGMRVDVRGIDIPLAPVVRYAARMLRELGYRARARLMPDINGHFEFVNDSRNHAQIGFYGWIADYLTPSSFIEWPFTCRRLVPRSSTNLNASQFCDAKVDRAFDRAYAAGPGGDWTAVEREILRSAPAVPLISRRAILLVSDRVGNVEQHGQLGPLLDQFWVH